MEQHATSRSEQLDEVLHQLLRQSHEIEAAAVVSFDGLPMASALPRGMDEDRVAAMSAALLSLGERAAAGLGRGELQQVYIEGEDGTVFLVSADNEAVLVAVAAAGAKVGMMLYEVRRSAAAVADVLRLDEPEHLEPEHLEPEHLEPERLEPEHELLHQASMEAPAVPLSMAPGQRADTVAAEPYPGLPFVPEPYPAEQPVAAHYEHAPLQPEVVAAVSGMGNGWSSYRPDGSATTGEPHAWS